VIKLWNVRTWQLTLTLTGHTGDITGLAFSPDGSSLCSASQDKKGSTVRVWRADPLAQAGAKSMIAAEPPDITER
jgi:WD40 repeat protein